MSTPKPTTLAKEVSEAEIIAGGAKMPGLTKKGDKVELFVKKVSFLDMGDLAAVWGNLKGELSVYLDMKEDQLRELTDATLSEAAKEGRRLNFTALSGFNEIQLETVKALGGGDMASVLEKALERVGAAQART